jgi:hypothetical protein
VVGEAARRCPALKELHDFDWAQPILAEGASKLGFSKKLLGPVEAAALGALLPRTASTLTTLTALQHSC